MIFLRINGSNFEQFKQKSQIGTSARTMVYFDLHKHRTGKNSDNKHMPTQAHSMKLIRLYAYKTDFMLYYMLTPALMTLSAWSSQAA